MKSRKTMTRIKTENFLKRRLVIYLKICFMLTSLRCKSFPKSKNKQWNKQ